MSISLHPTKNRDIPESDPRKHWYVKYRPHGRAGREISEPFYGTKAAAKELNLALRRKARKTPVGVNPQFARIIVDFAAYYKLEHTHRTYETAMQRLDHLRAYYDRMPLTAITPAVIEQYKRERVQHVKPITVNKELNILSAMLKWARDENLLDTVPVIKLFPAKMTRSPLPTMPTADELERIVAQVRPEVRGLAMLMLYAGLRRNEATRLKAEHVLLSRNLLIVRGKGNKQRIVPVVHPALIEELRQRCEAAGEGGYLWINPRTDNPYSGIDKELQRAAKAAGVSLRVYHHLLRHGFGTGSVEDGIGLKSLQELMGHSSSRTTEMYVHLAADHLIKEMGKKLTHRAELLTS